MNLVAKYQQLAQSASEQVSYPVEDDESENTQAFHLEMDYRDIARTIERMAQGDCSKGKACEILQGLAEHKGRNSDVFAQGIEDIKGL